MNSRTQESHGPVAWAMKNRQVVLIVTGILLLFGGFSLQQMPRQEFPEFKVRQGLVVGVYPGATSEEVEERLTKKVESYLFGFKEVDRKKTWSISRQGRMYIFVEIAPEVVEPELFWSKIRLGLNELRATELPPQVLAVQVATEFGDVSAIVLSVQSKGKSYQELGKELDRFETILRKVDGVSKVRSYGRQSERILIRLQKDRMAAFHLQPASIWAAMKLDGGSTAAGSVHQDHLELPIHIPNSFQTELELANAVIYADATSGHVVRLRDVATIVRDHGRLDSYVEMNGERALLVSLEMKQGNNIVAFGKEIDKAIQEYQQSGDNSVVVTRIVNMPDIVQTAVSHFMRDFVLAILSVILVTMLLLPMRVAAVAAMTIPICILITLGIMQLFGMELNTVSLASLIIVLGMVVDNAIIVIDDHVERLDQGESLWHAALHSSKSLFAPVFSATLAIIMAFIPLMIFIGGTSGDFIRQLPITVGIALLISLTVSTFLVPVLNLMLIRQGILQHGDNTPQKKTILDRMQTLYNSNLAWAFQHPILITLIGVASVVLALAMATQTKQQLFPKMERNQFAVEITLPEGRGIVESGQIAGELALQLRKDPRVVHVANFIGTSSPRFHATYAPAIPATNFAQLLVTARSEAACDSLLDHWQTTRNEFPDARIRWKQIEMNPTKSPIEVRIIGDSLALLHQVANQVKQLYQATPGLTWIEEDYMEKTLLANVQLDREAAAYAGLTRDLLSNSLAMGSGGLPSGTIWENDVPVRIELSGEAQGRVEVGRLGDVLVPSLSSQTMIPLRQVAKVSPDWTEGQIAHRNGVRTLTIRADVLRKTIANEVWKPLRQTILQIELPPGVQLQFGGEEEGEVENYEPLGKALVLGIFSIFLILLFQFRSAPYALLIMGTMPLSLFGAVLGLLLTGYPFGFTSFVGIISLFGMVVRNGIILVRYAEELREKGMASKDAAIAAGKRRMRPIFLTSAAAAIGVVPLITSGSTLWGGLGSVICFGLIFSTILTLFVLPVLYWGVSRFAPKHEVQHA